jgi:hypothetical protein
VLGEAAHCPFLSQLLRQSSPHSTFEEIFVFLRFELLQKNRAMSSMAKLSPLIAKSSPFLA